MNLFTKEQLLQIYPDASNKDLNAAVKYQEKFSLTLNNLKCLNPECNNIRNWQRSRIKFNFCCNNLICNEITKKERGKIGAAKSSATYEQRTGYKKPGQNPDIKRKQKENYLKNYGVLNIKQKHITNFKDWNNKQFWIDNFIVDGVFDNYKCMEYFNCSYDTVNLKIIELEIERKKRGGTSLKEQALIPILNNLNIHNIVTNTRNIIPPLELDIYLPDYNLAIEYNGAYWHQDSKKPADYHQSKSIACLSKGIRLIHIFEGYNDYNLEETLKEFLNYKFEGVVSSLKQANNEPTVFDLTSGCYPLGSNYKIEEPELINIMGFNIYDAGKIQFLTNN